MGGVGWGGIGSYTRTQLQNSFFFFFSETLLNLVLLFCVQNPLLFLCFFCSSFLFEHQLALKLKRATITQFGVSVL